MVHSHVVLVGGGTGFVGRHLVNLLRSDGAKVRVITRKPGSSQDQISWDTIKNKGLPSDTTAVVNLAGRNIFDPALWTDSFKREVYESRINTNKLLVDAINAATQKPRAFVTVSGVGYYPPSQNVEYDEDWKPTTGDAEKEVDFLVKLAQDWENASDKLNETDGGHTRRVVIRSGVVIGKDGGILQNMSLPFKFGLGGHLGDGKQWLPWIHVDDLANMFKFAILNNHVEGVINGVAPDQKTNKEFTALFAANLSRPALLPQPGFVVKLVFGPDRAGVLLKGQRVKSRASLLGYRYLYPTLDSAIKASI